MKKRWMALPVALMMLVLTSCLNDNEPVVNRYYDFLTVSTGGINPVFESDFGYRLLPDASFPADTFQVGERYYLSYIFGDTTNHASHDYEVNVEEYQKVEVRDILVCGKDSDDVWAKTNLRAYGGIWVSNNYLNALVYTFAPVSSGNNNVELIRFKEDETATPADTAPLLHFELRHDADLVYSQLFAARCVSFSLDSLAAEFPNATHLNLSVSWFTVSADYSYTFKFVPNEDTRSLWGSMPLTHWLHTKPAGIMKALRNNRYNP